MADGELAAGLADERAACSTFMSDGELLAGVASEKVGRQSRHVTAQELADEVAAESGGAR